MNIDDKEYRRATRQVYPKAVCIKLRDGWGIYTRRFGNKIGEGNTRLLAWVAAAMKPEIAKHVRHTP